MPTPARLLLLGLPALCALRVPSALRRAPVPRMAAAVPGESCTGEKVVVVGATGYIGKAVVRESVARGYPTTAVVRDAGVAAVGECRSERPQDAETARQMQFVSLATHRWAIVALSIV